MKEGENNKHVYVASSFLKVICNKWNDDKRNEKKQTKFIEKIRIDIIAISNV